MLEMVYQVAGNCYQVTKYVIENQGRSGVNHDPNYVNNLNPDGQLILMKALENMMQSKTKRSLTKTISMTTDGLINNHINHNAFRNQQNQISWQLPFGQRNQDFEDQRQFNSTMVNINSTFETATTDSVTENIDSDEERNEISLNDDITGRSGNSSGETTYRSTCSESPLASTRNSVDLKEELGIEPRDSHVSLTKTFLSMMRNNLPLYSIVVTRVDFFKTCQLELARIGLELVFLNSSWCKTSYNSS